MIIEAQKQNKFERRFFIKQCPSTDATTLLRVVYTRVILAFAFSRAAITVGCTSLEYERNFIILAVDVLVTYTKTQKIKKINETVIRRLFHTNQT